MWESQHGVHAVGTESWREALGDEVTGTLEDCEGR